MVNKIANLRIFDDDLGVMNKSLLDIEDAGILFISNFTLYGNAQKGFRPSYIEAARGEVSQPIYEQFVQHFKNIYSDKINIQSGIFGAMMEVELVNDGPVTLVIEK
jgi:D-tyrosyl-tRNA(Tyr) deacylase